MTRRPGRRSGESGTREAILEAARAQFIATGFRGTTIRSVAKAAGVDPALVLHFFGNKDTLYRIHGTNQPELIGAERARLGQPREAETQPGQG